MTSSDQLQRLRGDFPRHSLNARRVAGAIEAPGCHRRTVLDAAAVDLDRLGSLVSGSPRDRQSPFALARGNQFETLVIESDMSMGPILALARRLLGLTIPAARQADLSVEKLAGEYPTVSGLRMNELRAKLTKQYVEDMLWNPDGANNLIRHAVTRLNFGGETVYLELDVLAFAVEGRLHVVEIKSYPRIDGRADPKKASATVRQTAVYVLSLQELMRAIGAPPDLVSTTILVVLPENLSFRPTGVTIDIDIYVRRLRRQLAQLPQVDEILSRLPLGTALPRLPEAQAPPEAMSEASAAASEVLAALPARFGDGCVSCPLFRYCRDEAERHGSPARLGAAVAGACGSVTDIMTALDLAAHRRVPANASEAAVGVMLARGLAAENFATGGRA